MLFIKLDKFILLAIFLLVLGCEAKKQPRKPDRRFHENDLRLTPTGNLVADTSHFSSFLLKHNIDLGELADLAVDSRHPGSVLLLFRSAQVIRLNKTGEAHLLIDAPGQGPGEMMFPRHLKVENNNLFILDRETGKVTKYTLDGKHLKDITIPTGGIEDFDVTKKGHILVINISPPLHDGALLLEYDEHGDVIDAYGNTSIIQPILKETKNFARFLIDLSPGGKAVITSILTGKSFVYDIRSDALIGKFSIRNGQEWDNMVKYKQKSAGRGFITKINDEGFLSDGTIVTSWGGIFKNYKSEGMMYRKVGVFQNRIFGVDSLKLRLPTLLAVENDTTVWIYNRIYRLLKRHHLRAFHK